MAKKPSKPQDVENYKHDAAKRTMIPTAEQQGFVEEDEARPIKLRYPRNTDLDPQLVWRGKDAEDATDLYVDAPPVYIQEKIHPRAIIERLKRDTARRREAEAEIPDLFADFNGRPEQLEARTEFYQHEQNWQNRMILGDALMVMGSLAERENLRGKVQCIYIDPPYGIKFNSNWQASTGSRDVKDSAAFVSREPEVVRAFRDTWKDGVNSYLSYLRDRLIAAKDLLHETGSIFVQIGDENVHRVRALLDEVFGPGNFVSNICYQTTPYATSNFLPPVYDQILWYGKNTQRLKFHQLFKDKADLASIDRFSSAISDDRGRIVPASQIENTEGDLPSGWNRFQSVSLTSPGPSETDQRFYHNGGVYYPPKTSHWKTVVGGLIRVGKAGRIHETKNGVRFRSMVNDALVSVTHNIWTDTSGGISSRSDEKVYVVQTSPEVVKRCILMTTDPGDIVLDPTCGSGTTALVSEIWGRRWITIDTSRVALALARTRIMSASFPYFLLRDSESGDAKECELTGTVPLRKRFNNDVSLGFVYRRVPHIVMSDIGSNSEIDSLWDDFQPAVDDALQLVNESLIGQPEPFPVTTGGRRGDVINFTSSGNVTLPSGESAPKNGFMEWEVPRDPGTPWPEDQQKLYALAKTWDPDATPAKRRKAEEALANLNKARGESWTIETLPERPVTRGPRPPSRHWKPSGTPASPGKVPSTPPSSGKGTATPSSSTTSPTTIPRSPALPGRSPSKAYRLIA